MLRALLTAMALAWVGMPSAYAQLPVGTPIVNVATVEYVGSGGVSATASSNRVEIVTAIDRTAATLELLRHSATNGAAATVAGTVCVAGTARIALGAPQTFSGRELDIASPLPLVATETFHAGEAVFVRIVDRDQNLDGTAVDSVRVAVTANSGADAVTVELAETGPATGTFTGFVPTAAGTAVDDDCTLTVARGGTFSARYVDPADNADTAAQSAEVDPAGRVFDALTGAPVDGTTITLVDAVTGAEALVYGDDGTSVFPASVVAGGTVVDAGGTRYTYAPGEFRFPLIPDGEYRFEVEPPAGYLAPSGRPAQELQSLAGAPFLLLSGSFGERFSVAGAPFVAIDVPVDPVAGDLFLSMAASTALAAVGDFVEFRLAVTHADGSLPAEGVVVRNVLPAGLRLESGTARLRGSDRIVQATIGDDGRTLEFPLGTLAPGESVELAYVAFVVGGGPDGVLTSSAVAAAADRVSNEASVSLTLADEFLTDTGFIAGRVRVGGCDAAGGDGFAGVRVFLEDGRFAVTDAGGRYHFEGVVPGTHVVQVDVESIGPEFELVSCSGVASAGSALSRFVDLTPGQFRRADFAIARRPPLAGAVSLQLSQRVETDGTAERFDYTIAVGTQDPIPTGDVQVMLMLPPGVRFVSATLDDGRVPGVTITDQIVVVPLGPMAGPWRERLAVRARSDGSADGELVTRALARFEFDGERHATPVAETVAHVTPRVEVARDYVLNLSFDTLSAELAAADRARLDEIVPELVGVGDLMLDATGHSDAVPISPQSRTVFTDNYALSAARARAVADYLRERLALDPLRVRHRGLGPDRPVASNATAAGRRANRRVELSVSGRANAAERQVAAISASSAPAVVDVVASQAALPPMFEPGISGAGTGDAVATRPDAYDTVALEPGTAWLWPPAGHAPPIPNTKVAIKHARGDRVVLRLNNRPVDPLNFEGTDASPASDVVVSRWRGLDLDDGENRLSATIERADGSEVALERGLHFAGTPIRGRLLKERSALVADGRSRPVLAVELEDRWGQPAREGATGEFEIGGPYRSWWEIERLNDSPLVATGDRSPTYLVGRDGIALIELEPTTTTGQVELTLKFPQGPDQVFRAYVEPGDRDWVLVGLAEGTLAYSRVAGNVELGAADGAGEDYYDDGRVAFYAKGRVRGALLTAAFDTQGRSDTRFDPFGGAIDPDRYYTIYGDNTEQRFDAPSRERLYVKVERDAFFAMAGDFETGLTVTELSRYSRSMTGLSSARYGDRVSYSAFAARAEHGFVRDELRGDSTSGPYRLSEPGVLAGSDKIVIEARDRFRPDRIVTTKALRRHLDYDIDYTNGTLFLREPLPSRDFEFNPVYLVVDYEIDTRASGGGLVAGGRVAVSLPDDGGEVGVTMIDDATTGAEARLLGTDFRYRPTRDLEVAAELARTERTTLGAGAETGSAWLVEAVHASGTRHIEAYLRETDSGFGVGQQRATDPGTRRGGVLLQNEIGPAWRVDAEAYRQSNLAEDNSRTVVETQSRYEDARRTASFGLRRIDESIAGTRLGQSQSFVGGSWRFFDDLLTTRISLEDTIGGSGSLSSDYPTRTLVGADLSIGEHVSLLGEHEIAAGSDGELTMTRLGIRATPARGTEIDTTMQRDMTEYGPRSFATLGMRQSVMLGERWALDFGGELSARVDAGERLDPRVPPASGSAAGDFEAGHVGVAYRAPAWSFTSRLEHRDGDGDRHRGLIGSFFREQRAGRGFTAELRVLDRRDAAAGERLSRTLRLGWAYRPDDSRWMLFDRADLIAETAVGIERRVDNRRLVNNFNAHYALGQRQELAVKYSLKAVTASFDTAETHGLIDLLGLEWRRQLAPRYDIGLQASTYRAIGGDLKRTGYGFDVGIAVATNFNLRVGYNVTGFEDADFARAHYTARGPFVQFRLKLDQASLKDLLRQ